MIGLKRIDKIKNKPFKFENFDLYNVWLEFVNKVYKYTEKLPATEKYGLYSQLGVHIFLLF